MRIVYGIHGYGRGHATRAMAVLPELSTRHEVLVMAGGDAYAAIWPDRPVVRIPTLGFAYGPRTAARSTWHTIAKNTPAGLDLMLHGPAFDMVRETISDFAPNVVISDAEAWTHHAARALGIPRISFDHIGIMAYCKPEFAFSDKLKSWGDTQVYKMLMGKPDRIIVSSFYDAPPRRPGVCCVGTLTRKEIRAMTPRDGEHLLVYLNKGQHQFTPTIRTALEQLSMPVRIYGTAERGTQGHLTFCPTSNLPFIEDLASCVAVVSTAGNQLVGEAMHLRKPILVMPEECVEQRMNAAAVARMNIGMQAEQATLNVETLRLFLSRRAEFAEHMAAKARDGLREAVDAIERYLVELAPPAAATSPQPKSAAA